MEFDPQYFVYESMSSTKPLSQDIIKGGKSTAHGAAFSKGGDEAGSSAKCFDMYALKSIV